MAWARDLLASDDDRERCAAALARHYVAGRLTLPELESRLEAMTADLPRPSRTQAVGHWLDRVDRLLLRAHATTFIAINVLLIAIWALLGSSSDFWPAWALVPTAVLLAWHAAGSWTVRRMVEGPPRRR
jgi:hypothetical protein